MYVEMFMAVTIVINRQYSSAVGYGTLDQYPFNHVRYLIDSNHDPIDR